MPKKKKEIELDFNTAEYELAKTYVEAKWLEKEMDKLSRAVTRLEDKLEGAQHTLKAEIIKLCVSVAVLLALFLAWLLLRY